MDDIYRAGEILPVYKPLFWSSFDLVYHVRKKYPGLKVGHAGTLDPMADGLMVLCTGKKTKIIQQIQDADKQYSGVIRLGGITESFDLEKPFIEGADPMQLFESEIKEVANTFLGLQEQIPPAYSAIKVNGERSFHLTNTGREAPLKARPIQIHSFLITDIKLPFIGFQLVCSKGTYVRSLARDLGEKLGVGGFLVKLTRTAIGEYSIKDANREFEGQLFGKAKAIQARVHQLHSDLNHESLPIH